MMATFNNRYAQALGNLPVTMTDDEFIKWVKDDGNEYLYEKIDGGRREALVDALEAFTLKAESLSNEDTKDMVYTRCLVIMEEIHKIDQDND